MVTVRCTRKLLERLRSLPSEEVRQTSTKLGDWHAHLLYRQRAQFAMFVNDASRLPVLLPVNPAATLLTRFPDALGSMLLRLGVTGDVVEAELNEMNSMVVTKTSNRSVLGSINDFEVLLGAQSEDRSLEDAALRLSDAPCSPLGMGRPREVAVELLSRWS